MAKIPFVLAFAFLSMVPVYGQLIKKQVKLPPSPLERIHINEHFSYETLDVVYKTLIKNYGLKIVYDSNYCKRRRFSYWFMNTPAPLAIEITTRDLETSYRRLPPLTFSIDSTLTITVKKGPYKDIDIENDPLIEELRYAGITHDIRSEIYIGY